MLCTGMPQAWSHNLYECSPKLNFPGTCSWGPGSNWAFYLSSEDCRFDSQNVEHFKLTNVCISTEQYSIWGAICWD